MKHSEIKTNNTEIKKIGNAYSISGKMLNKSGDASP